MRWSVTGAAMCLGALGCTPDFDALDPSLGGASGDGGSGASAVGGAGASSTGASGSGGAGTGGAGTGASGSGGSVGTGGAATGDGKLGSLCGGSAECTSGFCVDGVCCQSACAELCAVCGSDGQCGPAPKYNEEPGCEITEACGGGTIGSCKKQPGQPCANNGQCLSSSCDTTCN